MKQPDCYCFVEQGLNPEAMKAQFTLPTLTIKFAEKTVKLVDKEQQVIKSSNNRLLINL